MGPGPWPWPKSHRLIQVAGGGTHSTAMKNLCVCGKTVKVTDRKWASKTVRVKVALWRARGDSREKQKVKVPDPRKSYPQPMVPKWFRAWLRVGSSTEVCPTCRRPQFSTAFRVRIRNSHVPRELLPYTKWNKKRTEPSSLLLIETHVNLRRRVARGVTVESRRGVSVLRTCSPLTPAPPMMQVRPSLWATVARHRQARPFGVLDGRPRAPAAYTAARL
jgi:hypothetical protein